MRIFHSFLRLKTSEKIIIIKALFLLWTIRIMLWTLPFSVIQKIIKKFIVIPDKKELKTFSMEKLTWAIKFMSTYTPKATCLTQALAAQILLARYHHPSNIKIGVTKNEGEFEAHAWLETDEKILLGKSEKEYTPILKMGEKTQ